ncbi:VCBS repeat-containing protein [Conexibacter sp. CPCC 206217]|uniref:FG-GAP repeat domain-containing protein n=1 Tax=Conexibacter sp. CPCC 206217 TaxID=3064574 RepID=UPI002721DBE7|nr:VCBS repeat-containing protein [Conexibacter sp. CPCC 206217]MDO8209096.1 VCBS repeat-containing protein [Conexibacter sp. CPCC 206217]
MSHRSSRVALVSLLALLATPPLSAEALEFGEMSDSWLPGGASDAVVADFGPDGRPEIAVSLAGSRQIAVLVPDEGRIGGASYSTLDASPTAVTAGDIDGDGHPELATVNRTDGSFTITGSSRLGPVVGYWTEPLPGSDPVAVAIADFDGVAGRDLAVVNNGAPGYVQIVLNDGTPSAWTTGVTVPTGSFPGAIAVGDFNGDGNNDLAVADVGSNTVTVASGDGGGGFGAPSSFFVGSQPTELLARDVDGDDKLDLITLNSASDRIGVSLGNGDGTFAATTSYPVGPLPQSLAAGDFNGDGALDLATIRGGVGFTVLLGGGNGEFVLAAGSPFATRRHPTALVAVDLDGDGLDELVAIDGPGEVVEQWTNTSSEPALASAPTVSGTPRPGETLTCQHVSWSGSAPIADGYAWSRDGDPIADADGAAYVVSEQDSERELRCAASASNELGSTTVTSDPLGVPVTPTVVTGSATAIATTAATLNGLLTPSLASTTYHFEYGPNAAYGSSTPDQTVVAGRAPSAVSAALVGLEPDREYHVRLVATNLAGTTAGTDVSFTTPAVGVQGPPPVGDPPVVAVPAAPRLTGSPPAVGTSRDVEIVFATDDATTAECRLDGGPWMPCGSPLRLRGLNAGNHAVAIRAQAGGRTSEPVSVTFQVDPYPPGLTVGRGRGGIVLRGGSGRALLPLACSPQEGARSGICSGTVSVRRAGPGASTGRARLATGSFRLRAGERTRVQLRLSAYGHRTLRAVAGPLRVRVVIGARDLAGNRRTLRLTARLRR